LLLLFKKSIVFVLRQWGNAEKVRALGVEAARFFSGHAQQLAQINQLIDEGKLKIYVETVLPLAEAPKALKSKGGRTRGKTVLQVGTSL
jgi:NADPH:quinone reductase-like Zn-dependent oxidoreductase